MACRRPIEADAIADTLDQNLMAVKETRQQIFELHSTLQNAQALLKKGQIDHDNLVKTLARAEGLGDTVADSMASIERNFLEARGYTGARIIQTQENERRHLAREIHDGPAQAMANLVMRVEICERLLTANRPEVMQELTQLRMLVKESLREVRQIIFDLHPLSLDSLGLVPAIERYFANLQEREGEAIQLRVVGTPQGLPPTVKVALFRMIQEAVSNARKHAQSTQIQVHMEFHHGHMCVCVQDDGIGFDTALVETHRTERQSFGLTGMRERAALLGGQLSVVSQPGAGTTVNICVPLLREE